MDAKRYLRQIRVMETRISMRQRQIRDLRRSMSYLRSMDYSADRVQTTPNGSGFTTEAIRLADLEMEAEKHIRECEALRAKIVHQIEGLENPNYIELLKLRYIDDERFEAIACTMGYTYSWTIQLHGIALQAFAKKYLSGGNSE